MSKILVFTPTLNEEKNIKKLINKIILLKLKLSILIIDDNSSDKTIFEIKKFKKKYKYINFIVRNRKLGIGSAHFMAFKYAIKNNYKFLITLDSDLSHNPNDIPKFIKNRNKFDFIIGSRFCKNGSSKLKGLRGLISKFGNIILKKVINENLTEFTTSYRLYNRKVLNYIVKKKIFSNGYSFFMNIVFEISIKKFTVKEIPIIFLNRKYGKSKMPSYQLILALLNFILLIIRKIFKN